MRREPCLYALGGGPIVPCRPPALLGDRRETATRGETPHLRIVPSPPSKPRRARYTYAVLTPAQRGEAGAA